MSTLGQTGNYSHARARKNGISHSTIILIAFASVYFPRLLDTVGFPSAINFLHFLIVPSAVLINLLTTKAKSKHQIQTTQVLAGGLFVLLGAIAASALFNQAGIVNVFFEYLLLAEPFIFLIGIICVPLPQKSLKFLRVWMLIFAVINFVLATLQWILIETGLLAVGFNGDYGQFQKYDVIQGVFYLSGAGNYISASVSISVAIYCFFRMKSYPFWLRSLGLAAAAFQLIISDSKQVLLAYFVGWIILVILQFKQIGKLIAYFIVATISLYGFVWCIHNIDSDFFSSLRYWVVEEADIYRPGGEAFQSKTLLFQMLPAYYDSGIDWLFGIGPGHTVGRLGGWILKDYRELLEPLGATIHPASSDIWTAMFDIKINRYTTMFSPFFGWAGIWGDLGFFGLCAYLFMTSIVWRYFCLDSLAKHSVLTALVFGLIFTQMEEPGYMLTVAFMLGLQWHENN